MTPAATTLALVEGPCYCMVSEWDLKMSLACLIELSKVELLFYESKIEGLFILLGLCIPKWSFLASYTSLLEKMVEKANVSSALDGT